MASTTSSRRRYAGKTHEQRRSERRARLLDAGLELFGSNGYAHTTIEMVCDAARLNPRYFYEEFESREELLGAVYDRYIETVTVAVMDAIAEAPLDPRTRLHIGLRAFLDAALADSRGARVNYFEMVGVSAGLERRRRAVLRFYADLVAAQITEISRTRPIPVTDHRLAAVAMVGATDGLIIDWLSSEKPPRLETIIQTLLELVDATLERR